MEDKITGNLKLVEEPKKTLAMHPRKFGLWLFMVTVVMIFAALTSAYIVRQGEGNWTQFDLPMSMWVSSVLILISSVTMHWALVSAKSNDLEKVKLAISITSALGVAFLISQLVVWSDLVADNIYFVGNPSGSF